MKSSAFISRRRVLNYLGSSASLGLFALACSDGDRTDGSVDEVGEPGSDAGDVSSPDDRGRADASSPACSPTTQDLEGPYYEPGAPARRKIAADDEPGERLIISGTVYGPDCETLLPSALIDVWQADKDGEYHGASAEYRLRGQIMTDADGGYEFETIMPGRYAQSGGYRPAHIHFMVSRPGNKPLTTQLYFAGDPYLPPNDACGPACNSSDPERIIDLTGAEPKRGTFDIILLSS